MSNKKSWTKRYYIPLIREVKKVKEKTGKNHTTFIEEAIDEKLRREGHIEESLLLNEVNDS